MTTTKRDKHKLRECWPPAVFVLVCLGTAALWFSAFRIKHPFRETDILIEGSLLAAAILGWAFVLKLRLRMLSLGWAMFTYALFMDLLDEFTKEPELWNTIIPGILSTAGLVLVAAGFYSSHRLVRGELARTQAAEASARENENRKRALLDALPDLVFRLSREGRFLDFHAPSDDRLFAQPEAFLGKALGEVLPSEIAARALLEVRATLDTRQMRILDYQLDLPGQGLQDFEARMVAGGENEVLAVVRNVTEPRRAAERLRESERRLQQITDAVPGAVFQFQMGGDGAKRFNFFSRGALDLFGCTAEQLRGNPDLAWSLVVPEDRLAVNESIRASARSVTPWSAEFRVQTGGSQPKWIRGTSVPEPPRLDGSIVWNGFFVDISESKRAEAERAGMERRLQEGQKLESLGVMAGGIAHDFNNLLTAILGNASLARTDLPEDSPTQDFLKQVETASLRAADLCKQMLAYAGKGRFVSQNLNLSALVDDALPLLRLSVSKRVTLEFDLSRTLPAVHADVTQMRQILMNLVINASEALGENNGGIFISTGIQRADRAYLADMSLAGDLAEGDYVFLRVRDTGAGMPPETAAKIFDPFFTTKFMGRGLGLAAVLGIVRGHQGGLKVETEVGRGSTFTLLLPPVAGAADTL